MKTGILIVLLLQSLGILGQAPDSLYRDLSVNEFRKVIGKNKVQLVDVRTPAEYREGHIAGARNIDLRSPGFDEAVSKLDPRKPVAVYCRSGVRSRAAARKLIARGFKVYNLDKGYLSWRADSLSR